MPTEILNESVVNECKPKQSILNESVVNERKVNNSPSAESSINSASDDRTSYPTHNTDNYNDDSYYSRNEFTDRNKTSDERISYPTHNTDNYVIDDLLPDYTGYEDTEYIDSGSSTVYTLPCKTGKYVIDKKLYRELKDKFPDMYVDRSIERLKMYLEGNPNKQGTPQTTERYLRMWLTDDNLAGKYRRERDGYPGAYDIEEYESTSVTDYEDLDGYLYNED